jgi:TRAP-type C4-dicarboxylate transport system substrate-binding protein
MKKAIFLLAVFGMILLTGIPVKKGEAAPKIMINAVSCWPITHVGNDYYKELIKRINEKCKGEIEIKLLGGPEVVAVFDQLKAAGTGLVDMIHGDPNYWAGIVPEGGMLTMAKHNFEVKIIRESGVLDLINQAYLERGKVLFIGGTWIGMPFYVMTNKPVSKLDDVRGLKLRGIGGIADVLLGELGVSVVKIASAETYEGLQRGIVDGVLRNTISLVEFKEYEVMKYILFPPIASPFGGVFISGEKWNSLPANLRGLIKEIAIAAEADSNRYYNDMDKARLKEATEKHGMKIINLSEKDIQRFSDVRSGAPVKEWIVKRSPKFGAAIYEKVLPYIK